VLVAVDDEERVLGGVTYIIDECSPYAEYDLTDAAAIRMLAVDLTLRRSGTGEALVRACIDRARAADRTHLVLHSTQWMTAAHALYAKLGFARDESLDWDVNPDVHLLGFRLALTD
jgi:GNAT superfamily N-acetyltransferase